MSNSFTTVTASTQFSDSIELRNHLLALLSEVKDYHEFTYTDLPTPWGLKLFEGIDEQFPLRKTLNTKERTLQVRAMPREIHDCVQPWITRAMYTAWNLDPEEKKLLRPGVGTTLNFQYGPYRGSRKEPDFFLRPDAFTLPTIAVETGWSETKSRLLDDMNVLLVGGNGQIIMVILVNWEKIQGEYVSGEVEVYRRDVNGMPRCIQKEVVFSAPDPPRTQLISLTRRDIFQNALLPNRNPKTVMTLDIAELRDEAINALSIMGLRPAV
ncbi:hypothetical protein N7493_004562 [Penicillium malachiteum]|uniref:Uncharacterized protein n=1 Tax=Penicillium malachiteum TaxID=1324776 RepID=A0AAD6MXE4_9EURO|nr:hypothetical protein N7493_004562 [Penicillium malachiteum]